MSLSVDPVVYLSNKYQFFIILDSPLRNATHYWNMEEIDSRTSPTRRNNVNIGKQDQLGTVLQLGKDNKYYITLWDKLLQVDKLKIITKPKKNSLRLNCDFYHITLSREKNTIRINKIPSNPNIKDVILL